MVQSTEDYDWWYVGCARIRSDSWLEQLQGWRSHSLRWRDYEKVLGDSRGVYVGEVHEGKQVKMLLMHWDADLSPYLSKLLIRQLTAATSKTCTLSAILSWVYCRNKKQFLKLEMKWKGKERKGTIIESFKSFRNTGPIGIHTENGQSFTPLFCVYTAH